MPARSVGGRLVGWLRGRAEGDRNSLSVTIVPAEATRVVQLDLPRWTVRLLVVLLVVGTVLIVGGAVLGTVLLRELSSLQHVQEENRALQEDVARVTELEQEVSQLDQIRRQLYALAGVPEPETTAPGTPSTTNGNLERPSTAASLGLLVLTEKAWATPLRIAPARGPVSRGFSKDIRNSPEHSGVDIAGAVGTDVLAAAGGVIVSARWDSTFGNMITIRHQGGWETRYGHNEKLLVAVGDSVRAGQQIARLGSTGRSSAPHLHFETIHDGAAVDPAEYFRIYQSGAIRGNR